MFDFAEMTKDMTANEILNYYRNLYYAEPQVTERGIVANAINDFLSEKEGEAEMLQGALKAEERHNELTMQIAQIALKNEKIEVARDIDDLRRYIILNEDIALKCKQENGEKNEEYWKGKLSAFKQIRAYIDAELKKKYTEESENER